MSSALYLLRCKQLGFSFEELDELTCGMVWDVLNEQINDSVEYPKKAGQKEFNEFLSG